MKTTNKNQTTKNELPTGEIAKYSYKASYGFNGSYYYVAVGAMNHFVTGMKLTFEEAKSLFDAMVLCEYCHHIKNLNSWIKEARKTKNVNLINFFIDKIENM